MYSVLVMLDDVSIIVVISEIVGCGIFLSFFLGGDCYYV